MRKESSVTETVVRKHLTAFLEQQGIAAIVSDYADDARLFTEARIYKGKHEVEGFFADFIDALPADGTQRFWLRNLRVDGDIALLTWFLGNNIVLGADTFVVNDGKIVSQTFAMQAGSAQ